SKHSRKVGLAPPKLPAAPEGTAPTSQQRVEDSTTCLAPRHVGNPDAIRKDPTVKSMSIRPAVHALMAGILAFSIPLAAVELSPSGEGGALIFPIWATTNGHLSVLSVVDSHPQSGFSG